MPWVDQSTVRRERWLAGCRQSMRGRRLLGKPGLPRRNGKGSRLPRIVKSVAIGLTGESMQGADGRKANGGVVGGKICHQRLRIVHVAGLGTFANGAKPRGRGWVDIGGTHRRTRGYQQAGHECRLGKVQARESVHAGECRANQPLVVLVASL